MTDILIRFKVRRGTAANLASVNETPLAGELVIETDTGKHKLGDGTTAYNSLAYLTTDATPEGSTNLYYTTARARSAVATGLTFTGKVNLPASTTTEAPLNLGAGTAPTSPVNGDVWMTASGIVVRLGGFSYNLPLVSASQTISGSWTFSAATNTFGSSTAASTTNIGSGATSTGNTKALNIGTGGVAGSTTNVTIGTNSGGASNVLIHGTCGFTQGAETTKSAAATLTAAEIATGIVSYTGAAANITMPTGTALDTGFAFLATGTAPDFAVINTGSGTATMVAKTGITSLGALAVAAGTSGQFRLRKTGTATYVLYRLS